MSPFFSLALSLSLGFDYACRWFCCDFVKRFAVRQTASSSPFICPFIFRVTCVAYVAHYSAGKLKNGRSICSHLFCCCCYCDPLENITSFVASQRQQKTERGSLNYAYNFHNLNACKHLPVKETVFHSCLFTEVYLGLNATRNNLLQHIKTNGFFRA